MLTRTEDGDAEALKRVVVELSSHALDQGVDWLSVQVPGEDLLTSVREKAVLPEGAVWEEDQAQGSQAQNGGGAGDASLRVLLLPSGSGRKNFVEAIAKLAVRGLKEGAEEQEIGLALGVPDVDLLILTGGDRHLPDLLLWQVVYSEIVVIDAPWPVVGRAHFEEALAEYARRNRRYGGLEPRP